MTRNACEQDSIKEHRDCRGSKVASFDYMMELINNNQINELNEALKSIAGINLKNDDSLLMRACKVGDEECVRLLLSHGADLSSVSHYSGHNALSLACLHGHSSIVELLLEHGADISLPMNHLPFIEACEVIILMLQIYY